MSPADVFDAPAVMHVCSPSAGFSWRLQSNVFIWLSVTTIKPCTDPVLSRSQTFRNLVKEATENSSIQNHLVASGMSRVVFCRKGGRLRMILDARMVNLIARCPHGVSFGTSEVLAQIELPVPGSYVETGRHILRETQATIGFSDVSAVTHSWEKVLCQNSLPSTMISRLRTSDSRAVFLSSTLLTTSRAKRCKARNRFGWPLGHYNEVLLEPLFYSDNEPSPFVSGPSGVLLPTAH